MRRNCARVKDSFQFSATGSRVVAFTGKLPCIDAVVGHFAAVGDRGKILFCLVDNIAAHSGYEIDVLKALLKDFGVTLGKPLRMQM